MSFGNGDTLAFGWTNALVDGQIAIGSTAGTPQAANITSTGGTISVTNGPNTINLEATGTFPWTLIGANQVLVVNNGYDCTGGATLSLSLPGASAVGDIIEVTLDGSTGWTITQGVGQQIRVDALETTLGVGGSLSSIAQGDSVRLVCTVASTKWNVLSGRGNLTVV